MPAGRQLGRQMAKARARHGQKATVGEDPHDRLSDGQDSHPGVVELAMGVERGLEQGSAAVK